MQRHIYLSFYSILFLILSTFISSCSNSTNQYLIGNDIVSVKTNVITSDTFIVQASTVRVDSVPTSGYSKGFVGTYIDNYFGTIDAKTIFQIQPTTNPLSYSQIAYFDSIVLIMKVNYSYGDTFSPFSIQVKQLHKNDTTSRFPIESHLSGNRPYFSTNPSNTYSSG